METVRLKTALIAAVLLTHCGSISAAAADDNGYGADDYGTQVPPAPAPPVAQAPPSPAPPPSPGPVPQAAAPTPKPPAPPPPAAAAQASAPPPPGPPSSAPTPQPPAPSPPAPTPNGHDHSHLTITTPVAGPQPAATPAVVPTPQPSAPTATPPPPAPSPPVPLAKPAPAPSWSPPTWNVPQIASNLPTPQVPKDFHYVVQTEKICAGVAYTDQSNIGCSGWQGISEVECQKKCTDNTAPSRGAGVPRCPTKTCYAAAVFSTSGWCHLFEAAQCRAQTDEPKVKLYLKTAKGGLAAIWNTPTMNKMKKGTDTGLQKFKKEMQTPIAQTALKAGAVVAAAGAVAAGVGGAIALQKQQEAEKKKQQQLRQQQQPRQRMGVVSLPTVAPTLPGNASSPDQSSSYILPAYSPNLLVTSTAPPAASSSLSAPSSSSSGIPIWLSLIAIGCCCCAIAFASIALMKMGNKRPRARRDESFDESEEEYEQEPAD